MLVTPRRFTKASVLSFAAFFAALLCIARCARDAEFTPNNPLDPRGENFHPPTVTIAPGADVSALVQTSLRAHAVDSNGTIAGCYWSMDAGATFTKGDSVFPHIFPVAGLYTVVVKARDNDSTYSQPDTCLVTVHAYAPTVRILQNNATVRQNDSLLVRAVGSDTLGTTYSFIWSDTNGVILPADSSARSTDTTNSRLYQFPGSRLYLIAVQCVDAQGQISAPDTLKVIAKGDAPILTSPVGGDTISGSSLRVAWYNGFYNAKKRLVIDSGTAHGRFLDTLMDSTQSSISVALDFGSTYRAQVIGYNGAGDSAVGGYVAFATAPEPPAANARLKSLVVSRGTLQPAFSSRARTYVDTVADTVTRVVIVVTPDTSAAIVTIDNKPTITPGIAVDSIALSYGPRAVKVLVLAPDGVTMREYTITVFRRGGDDAALSNLAVTSRTLAPAFNRDSLNYKVALSSGITSMQLTWQIAANGATVKVNNSSVTSPYTAYVTPPVDTVDLVVTAVNGVTMRDYRMIVQTRADTNAFLQSLSAGPAAKSTSYWSLHPTFSADVYEYADTVDYADTLYGLAAQPANAKAMVRSLGDTLKSPGYRDTVPLSMGKNAVVVRVSAEDTSVRHTYTINVIRSAPDTNVLLSGLASPTGLKPGFNADTLSYGDTVPYLDTFYMLTATVTGRGASLKINNKKETSGTAADSIRLAVGLTTIAVQVIAQDTAHKRTYTVAVWRTGPDTTTALSGLIAVSGLTPSFNRDTLAYFDTVRYADSTYCVTPAVSFTYETVIANGTPVTSGALSSAIPLTVGSNAIPVRVTAQDTARHRVYTVNVLRLPASANANLDSVILSAGALTPGLNATDTLYSATVPNAVASITIKQFASDSTATMTVNGTPVSNKTASGTQALTEGSNTIVLAVTAQDKTTKRTFTLKITRGAPPAEIGGDYITTIKTITKAGGPYHVTASIVVAAAGKLVIEPGVEMLMDPGVAITVQGTLVSKGSATDSIYFRAYNAATGKWGYIDFTTTAISSSLDVNGVYASGSVFEYCVLENGGNSTAKNGMVTSVSPVFLSFRGCRVSGAAKTGMDIGGSIKMGFCTVVDNGGDGVSCSAAGDVSSSNFMRNGGDGFDKPQGEGTISSSLFADNKGKGLNLFITGTVTGCVARHNGADGFALGSWYGNRGHLSNSTSFANTGCGFVMEYYVVDACTSASNKNGGVRMLTATSGSSRMQNSVIRDNTMATGNGAGVSMYTRDTVVNCIITNNATNTGTGGGVYGIGVNSVVQDNLVSQNSAMEASALYLTYDVAAQRNTISSNVIIGSQNGKSTIVLNSGAAVFTNNNIVNNTNAQYWLYNNNAVGQPNLNATSNYWGSGVTEPQVRAKTYDFFKDNSKSIVDLAPILSASAAGAPAIP